MKDKLVVYQAFPDYLAADEVKKTEEYGLQMAKAIEYEWFFRNGQGATCTFFDRQQKYHNLRLYARGEQSTDIYKNLLNNGEEASYTNYDWRPLQIIPKFVKLIVNQMSERLYDVKAEATDKYSTDLKDNTRKALEELMMTKDYLETVKEGFGIDLIPAAMNDIPDSQEEIDLYMALKYKPAIEIATEEAIKYTLDSNDYDEVQTKVIEDITTIGIGAVKHSTDLSKGIMVDYIDPADMVFSYPVHSNFKDVHYYGEVKRMTIAELKRISGRKFTDDELRALGKSSEEWGSYHNMTNQLAYTEENLDGMMVDVMHFTFKALNSLTYKKKKLANGGFRMTKKDSTFTKPEGDTEDYDVVKTDIDVWYEGSLVLGTSLIFNYKLCQNMIRQKGLINITIPNYILYAPDMYRGVTKSLVGNMIGYVDQMQQIHIKLQQMIAKARPNGVFIDINGLEEVPLGDGSFLTPLELVKIYDETGNVLGSSVNAEGDYNYGKETIKELKNGVIDGLDRLINSYNFYLNMLRDAVGIPQGADASSPHPDTAVAIQQQLALNSNTATRHILDSSLNITKRLSKGLSLRLSDIFRYSHLKEAYTNAIGKTNMAILKSIQNYHLHDLGINIELKPDASEKQMLEATIGLALKNESITLDDAIDIRSISNIKLANQVIRIRRVKREKEKKAFDLQKIQEAGQVQIQVNERTAQAKMQEYELKAKSEIAVENVKSTNKIKELGAEELGKSRLMAQEFDYNMQLAGLDSDTRKRIEDGKQQGKVELQDKGNTQASKLIEQRTFNEPALSFESSEDTLSGSMNIGEIGVT